MKRPPHTVYWGPVGRPPHTPRADLPDGFLGLAAHQKHRRKHSGPAAMASSSSGPQIHTPGPGFPLVGFKGHASGQSVTGFTCFSLSTHPMEFAVADDTYPVDESDVDVPDIVSTVPDLHEVLLTGPDLAAHSPVLAILWSRITRYRGFHSSGRQLDILENASNLIEYGITCDEDDTDDILLPHYVPTSIPLRTDMDYTSGSRIAHRPFFSMVRSRLSGRCPLTFARVITVYSDAKLRGVIEGCVHELAADGLDIDIAFLAGAEAHVLIMKDRP
ncbi:hypothetical protein B0H13DRAFT_1858226 [Mycena leptocephala]|nr:hypothetical protein B0H13DRAFT_1858226 [Mycena leptocephala]